jgi:integrase
MAVKWIKAGFPGVRFYKHESRKHGVKFDQYYAIRYQVDGKSYEEALGWASEGMTAEKAYKTRCELKEAAKVGGATTLKERRRLKADADDAVPTFKKAVEGFIEYCGRTLRPKTTRGYKDGLTKAVDFVPAKGTGRLGDWKLDQIHRRHLAGLIECIGKDSQSVAIQVRSSLSSFYTWALQSPREYVEVNIVRDIPRPPKPAPRERYLTGKEAGALWGELQNATGDPAMIRLIQFSLVVGCRLSEAIGMRRDEVDGNWWTIPAERSKGKRPHRIYLTPTAKALVDGKGKLVFPSSRVGRKKAAGEPFDPSSVSRHLKRKNYFGLEKFTCHDFRRTLGSGLAMLNFGLETIAATLGHKLQGVTAEHYVRHKFDRERQEAMIKWEAYLLACAGEADGMADVIPISTRRK